MDVDAALAATAGEVTPVAVCDERVLERNLARMADLAAAAGLRLRPHAKTHKSAHVARRQLAHGAAGVTAATLTEAEVFAAAGVTDVLLAHPPAGAPKLARLAALAGRVERLAVSLDSAALALALPAGVDVMWEVDTGLHRMGTAPGEPTAAAIAELLEGGFPEERLRGLLTHAGHAYAGDRAAAARDEYGGLAESADALRRRGVAVRELSVGSTPTARFAAAAAGAGVTEMRPGTYVYGDANQVALGSQALEDCALTVVATVVSVHGDRVIVDAGSKALPTDLRVAGVAGFGVVLNRPDLTLDRLNEEHGFVTGGEAAVGDRLVILPAHACTCVNLHPDVLFFGSGAPRRVATDARGWSPVDRAAGSA